MGLDYEVFYHPLVKKDDTPELGSVVAQRIKKAIEQKLMTHPEIYGIPLRHSVMGDRKFRVGDHRVVFRLEKKLVKVFLIEHRSIVYTTYLQRKFIPF